MNSELCAKLAAIGRNFRIPGEFREGEPYGAGHINDTYRVAYERCRGRRRYILQRINRRVFPHPERNMENIRRVTAHLHGKRCFPGAVADRPAGLELVPALDGRAYWVDGAGEYWRTYLFIENAYGCDVARHPSQARSAGAIFGRFLRDLADLPGPRLHVTIADFHHTPKRIAALQAAGLADPLGRAAACRRELDFVLSRAAEADLLVQGLADGTLPERTTHNDTKLNNVLFDQHSHRGICAVDFDTVMPGSVLYDFGDLVRTTAASAPEDESDPRRVNFRRDMFEALCEGYLGSAGSILTPGETALLAKAGPLICLELGARFLTDYLEGDLYFKTAYAHHNLVRCRVQLQLVMEMEKAAESMAAIIKNRLA